MSRILSENELREWMCYSPRFEQVRPDQLRPSDLVSWRIEKWRIREHQLRKIPRWTPEDNLAILMGTTHKKSHFDLHILGINGLQLASVDENGDIRFKPAMTFNNPIYRWVGEMSTYRVTGVGYE